MEPDENKCLAMLLMRSYLGEPCRICGDRIEEADLDDLVFGGYAKEAASRSAHGMCWREGRDKETWAYPEDE